MWLLCNSSIEACPPISSKSGIRTYQRPSKFNLLGLFYVYRSRNLNIEPHTIEHQLAHAVPDNLGGVYNRAKLLAQRKTMM